MRRPRFAFDEWVAKGPEGYDIAVEIIQEDDDEEWETLDYHEWFTMESWNEAHPSGFPDDVASINA